MEKHMGDRVRERRDVLGLTQADLAAAVGCSQPMIKKIEAGSRTSLGRKLSVALGVSLEWLETGEESVSGIETPAPTKHISASTDKLNKGHKSRIISASPTASRDTLTATGEKKFDQNVTPAPLGQRRIPVISYVQAGMMTEAVDPFELGGALETIFTDLDSSDQTFALIIEGTSMLPEFSEGDKIIIDPALSPRPGDFVVAKNGSEEATFKKYRPRGTNERGEMVFELVPLNDDFPTLNSERDYLRIIGVMVEHRKYRRR